MPKPPAAAAPTPVLASIVPSATAIPKKIVTAKRPLQQEEEFDFEDSQNPDEDKRRRNTAASARFRVKKKMREQAMEHSVREMTKKSDHLQDRVNNLETEIKFLRSLLLDKAEKNKA